MKIKICCKNSYEGLTGIYARVSPVKDTNFVHLLRCLEYEAPCKFNEIYDDPHVTIMYSKARPHPFHAAYIHDTFTGSRFCAKLLGFTYWPGHDKDGYIVARLLSPEMCAAHARMEKIGAVPTFKPYTPHMTIHKNFGKNTPELSKWMENMNRLFGRSPLTLMFKSFSLEPLKK